MRPVAPLLASTLLTLLAACHLPSSGDDTPDATTDSGADDTASPPRDSGRPHDSGDAEDSASPEDSEVDDPEDSDVDEPGDSDVDEPEDSASPDDTDAEDTDAQDTDDEDDPGTLTAWFVDLDVDGYGDVADMVWSAGQPEGYVAVDGDCDDQDPAVHPDADELCNGLDDDCDTVVDGDSALDPGAWYADVDQDGYGDPRTRVLSCEGPEGYVERTGDCRDELAEVHPGAIETCNGLDDDCDTNEDPWTSVDAPLWYFDRDHDGHGDPTNSKPSCAQPHGGWLSLGDDCDDTTPMTFPGAQEICDGEDNDCDGTTDAGTAERPWFPDADGDGYGDSAGAISACSAPEGYVEVDGDCDDADADASPAGVETCNGADDDCDGDTDEDDAEGATSWYADLDGDGYGDPQDVVVSCTPRDGRVTNADDCDDAALAAFPGGAEVCDGADNDCDGAIDEEAAGSGTWYADADGDGHGDPAVQVAACAAPDGYVSVADDCDDSAASAYTGAPETCDGLDNDCDGGVDEDDAIDAPIWYLDHDIDGYGDERTPYRACRAPAGYAAEAGDCDDHDGDVNPGAAEVCDGLDDDCDGTVDEPDAIDAVALHVDADGDGHGDPSTETIGCIGSPGFVEDETDCDDTQPGVFPGAVEVCNGLDDDCNGEVDVNPTDAKLYYIDADVDGFGDPSVAIESCRRPDGYSAKDTDCDDTQVAVHPGAEEVCNEVDDDCDGAVDDEPTDAIDWYTDVDGDGHGVAGSPTRACTAPDGMAALDDDCNDTDPGSFPGNPEVCNHIDDDCDGTIDINAEGAPTWYEDRDGDGWGEDELIACEQLEGYVDVSGDCDDRHAETWPGAVELCDEADNDCDGAIDEVEDLGEGDWYRDSDGDGFGDPGDSLRSCGAPEGYVADATDCNDRDELDHPGADETCDGVDNDCDGEVDDADVVPYSDWYADADGDGFGDPAVVESACAQPHDFVDDASDCDDADAAIHPEAPEQCDEIDNNCDGQVDELDGALITPWYADADGDGQGDASVWVPSCIPLDGMIDNADDCDDEDAEVFAGADEYCNGHDDNCDGTTDEDEALDTREWYLDEDGDGSGTPLDVYAACTLPAGYAKDDRDCDDADAAVSPSAEETCNGIDDNCDAVVDEDGTADGVPWYPDHDGDGYGDADRPLNSCGAPEGYVQEVGDCNDADADVHEGAPETCNDIDDDCNGAIDDGATLGMRTWYADLDHDGYGDPATGVEYCSTPEGAVEDASDCDDTDRYVNPRQEEVCNGVDDNCDGSTDGPDAGDPGTWYADADGDGYGDPDSFVTSCYAPVGYTADDEDCDDSKDVVSPDGVEDCATEDDDDCDGVAPRCGPFGRRSIDTADAMLDGSRAGDNLGVSLTIAPDLDGDGLDDMVVGAIGIDTYAAEAGGFYVFDSDVDGHVDASAAVGTVSGTVADGLLGRSVAGIGDVDGDGYGDLIVGANTADLTGVESGGAWLLHGPVFGNRTLAADDVTFAGARAGDWAGYSVAGGDLDGDGVSELLIGAPYEDTGGSRAGAVYIQGVDGLGVNATVIGELALDRAGTSATVPGDVDGDGIEDLLVGAWGESTVGRNAGAAYVLYGPYAGVMDLALADAKLTGEGRNDQAGMRVASPGDMDEDGLADMLVGADGIATSYLWTGAPSGRLSLGDATAIIEGDDVHSHAGGALDGAGDLDADGHRDLVIGAYAQSVGLTTAGFAFLVCGPLEGVSTLGYADGRLVGVNDLDQTGAAVAGGGDLDGDGFDDVLIGAWGADPNGSSSGTAYLFFGGQR